MPTANSKVVWADMTNVLARINQARVKHGLGNAALTNNTFTQAAQTASLVSWLTEANNRITGTKPVMNVGAASAGTIMTAAYLESIYNKASEVYNTCTCNANCSCNCNYSCTCDCDYGCTCQCNYGCTCQCNYPCTCQCNYTCTCDCNRCTDCPQCPQCPQCPNKGCLGAVFKDE